MVLPVCEPAPWSWLHRAVVIAVHSIEDAGNTVTVTLANGTNLTADYVIVTASLGVLKNGSIAFSPALPADKQAAIQNMVRCGCTTVWLCATVAAGGLWVTLSNAEGCR